MPEAAVHKHCQLESWEDKIRLSKHSQMAVPACDPLTAEELYQRNFRILVAMRIGHGG